MTRVLGSILLLICHFAVNSSQWVLTVEDFDASGNRVYELGISWGKKGVWRRITVADEIDIAKRKLPAASESSLKELIRKRAPRRSDKKLSRTGDSKAMAQTARSEKARLQQKFKISETDDAWMHWSYRGIVLDKDSNAVVQLKDTVGSEGVYHYAEIAVLQKWLNDGQAQIKMQDTKSKKHDTWDLADDVWATDPVEYCWISREMEGFPRRTDSSATGTKMMYPSQTPSASFPEVDAKSIEKSVDPQTGEGNRIRVRYQHTRRMKMSTRITWMSTRMKRSSRISKNHVCLVWFKKCG